MTTRSPSYLNSLDAISSVTEMFNYTHPDYRYYKDDWVMIRDAVAGERRVKDLGEAYLPRLGENSGTTYAEYLSRASFVNMTARTVQGLVGTLFRRSPRITGYQLSPRHVRYLETLTPDGASHERFAKTIASELAQVGRVGILTDMDANGVNPAYMTYYIAENILAWKTSIIDGKERLVYVLLREIVDEMNTLQPVDSTVPPPPVTVRKVTKGARQTRVARTLNLRGNSQPVLKARYRVLALRDGVYVQELYEMQTERGIETLNVRPVTTTIPTYRGAPMTEIPFDIIGMDGVKARVTKSPVYDICALNYAHYRTSAQLEHGRYFTALPVYYVQVAPGQEGGEYTVGPSVVWEVPQGEKPGLLEYYGTGLKELANSLAEKEKQVSQLGGKLFGIDTAQGSQAPEVAAMSQANEISVLISLCDAVSDGMTRALQRWAKWLDIPEDKASTLRYQINRDFASSNIGAREMRAIATLYQSGVLPIDEVFRVFQEAELVSDTTTLEDFVAQLNDLNKFPNQPDVAAMREGYPDASGKLQWDIKKAEREQTAELSAQARLAQQFSDQQNAPPQQNA